MKTERESLTRAIGTVGLAAGIVNVMIGGGIFRVPALVAASLGPAAPLAYVICAVAMKLSIELKPAPIWNVPVGRSPISK